MRLLSSANASSRGTCGLDPAGGTSLVAASSTRLCLLGSFTGAGVIERAVIEATGSRTFGWNAQRPRPNREVARPKWRWAERKIIAASWRVDCGE